MNASLTSSLPDFAKKSEFSKGPLAAEPSDKSPPEPTARNLIAKARSRLRKLMPFAFIRFLMSFFIGVAVTLAWQSYAGAARTVIAGWSPYFGWLAPAAPAGGSSERLKAASIALAALRQNVDKLTTEMGKLQAQGTSEKTSSSRRRGRGPGASDTP
jgi:hypothetical protein